MKIVPYLIVMLLNVLPACGSQVAGQATTLDEAERLEEAVVVAEFEPSEIIYSTEDSLRVVELLQQAAQRVPEMSRMEFFGRKFLNVPYVAHTLESDPEQERLVVNLKELDCTTYVETCAALSLADMRGDRSFEGFCRALKQLRYKEGVCDGYASRLHYFLTWTENNIQMGFLEDVSHDDYPFTAVKTIDLHYMSQNPDKYVQLAQHPEWIPAIVEQESTVKGKLVRYIPKELLKESALKLGDVRNGDIIGILTTKDGLDTTHLGIAIWQNGKLHLMNASSVYHKVVIDNNSFYDYMARRKQNLGIMLVRLKER